MGRLYHFEIPAKDIPAAAQFYSKVLDWKVDKWDGPEDYYLISTGPETEVGINGGFYSPGEGLSGVINTADVADLDAAMRKVTAEGGTIVRPRMPVMGYGWLAYAKDPEGNLFGMMQLDSAAK